MNPMLRILMILDETTTIFERARQDAHSDPSLFSLLDILAHGLLGAIQALLEGKCTHRRSIYNTAFVPSFFPFLSL